jgi:hypothetical protein
MSSVLRTEVVGLQYYSGAVLIEDCKLGDKVILKPNPENAIDENAIEIHLPNGELLGHVGREDAKYFKSIWSEIDEVAEIIALEGGLESECYSLKLAAHAKGDGLGLRKGVSTFSYQLKNDDQRAYIFVDCSLNELKALKEKLMNNSFFIRKDGECRWRTNDGHKYRWFISVSKSKDEFVMPTSLEIENFFLKEYKLVTRLLEIRQLMEKLASVELNVTENEEEIELGKKRLSEISQQKHDIETQKQELEEFTTLQQSEFDELDSKYVKLDIENQGRQNKIEVLRREKDKLSYVLSELGAPEGGMNPSDSTIGELIIKIFPHIEFIRDSFDILVSSQSKDLLAIIGRCDRELNTTIKSGWSNFSVPGWREHYFNLGNQKTGRLYALVDEGRNRIKLLISSKAAQDRDSKYLYKYKGGKK